MAFFDVETIFYARYAALQQENSKEENQQKSAYNKETVTETSKNSFSFSHKQIMKEDIESLEPDTLKNEKIQKVSTLKSQNNEELLPPQTGESNNVLEKEEKELFKKNDVEEREGSKEKVEQKTDSDSTIKESSVTTGEDVSSELLGDKIDFILGHKDELYSKRIRNTGMKSGCSKENQCSKMNQSSDLNTDQKEEINSKINQKDSGIKSSGFTYRQNVTTEEFNSSNFTKNNSKSPEFAYEIFSQFDEHISPVNATKSQLNVETTSESELSYENESSYEYSLEKFSNNNSKSSEFIWKRFEEYNPVNSAETKPKTEYADEKQNFDEYILKNQNESSSYIPLDDEVFYQVNEPTLSSQQYFDRVNEASINTDGLKEEYVVISCLRNNRVSLSESITSEDTINIDQSLGGKAKHNGSSMKKKKSIGELRQESRILLTSLQSLETNLQIDHSFSSVENSCGYASNEENFWLLINMSSNETDAFSEHIGIHSK